MLSLGGTKVEVGVQTTFERVNREMHRGHGVQASMDANRRLRDAAFKVGFHTMPGQPGMSERMVVEDFRQLFADPAWRPDYLKIYPTLVVRDHGRGAGTAFTFPVSGTPTATTRS